MTRNPNARFVKNNEILVVLDEGVSEVDMELAGNGGKSENIDGTDVSENGSTDVVEEGLQGLDWVSMRDDVAKNLVGRLR